MVVNVTIYVITQNLLIKNDQKCYEKSLCNLDKTSNKPITLIFDNYKNFKSCFMSMICFTVTGSAVKKSRLKTKLKSGISKLL